MICAMSIIPAIQPIICHVSAPNTSSAAEILMEEVKMTVRIAIFSQKAWIVPRKFGTVLLFL